jgi:hypothetical protein
MRLNMKKGAGREACWCTKVETNSGKAGDVQRESRAGTYFSGQIPEKALQSAAFSTPEDVVSRENEATRALRKLLLQVCEESFIEIHSRLT